ncbi:MAG: CPBP family intramembrane metalloprotease [Bacteroidales bacterium]|jgi:membrane protease YdiL (CAAX protease family)|nr:CPBP family intramembrane metalloprotease [Bacteroidales bacterium]
MSIKTMPVWKWVLLLLASFILALLMYAFSQLAADSVQPALLKWFVSIIVSVVMVALYAVFVPWFEKQPAKDIPLRKIPADTGKGLAVGAVFMLAVTLVMMLFGLYRIIAVHADDPLPLVTAFFLFLYVAVGEEILFRGVLFRWIDEKWGFVAALVVSSLLFGFMHYGQPGATWWSSLAIAIEAGLLLGAAYKYSGTLWLPIGIHWAWNFVQGNIFGFEVSGGDAGKALLQATVSGPDILTGGSFGAEASVITVVLGLALSLWYLLRKSS